MNVRMLTAIPTVSLVVVMVLAGCSKSATDHTQSSTPPVNNTSAVAGSAGSGPVATQTADGFKKITQRGFTLRWKFDGDKLNVIVSYPTTGWVAVGFGTTGTMYESNIIIGYVKDDAATIVDAFGNRRNAHANDTAIGGKDQLTNKVGTEVDGTTEISFTMPTHSNDPDDVDISEGQTYKVLLAHGPNGADNLFTYHGANGRTVVDVTL